MRKIRFLGILLVFGLTINSILGQKNFTDFNEELHIEIAYKNNPSISTCNGEIEIVHSVLSPPYLYSIDGGKTFSSSPVFSGLCSQKYFVHVRDANSKLGLALVNFTAVQESIPVLVDTLQLLTDFENANDPNEKRSLQSQLSVIGIKFPVKITKLSENKYSFPMIRIPSDNDAFSRRTENIYDNVKKISVSQGNLIIEFIECEPGYLDKVADKLGYNGYELINE